MPSAALILSSGGARPARHYLRTLAIAALCLAPWLADARHHRPAAHDGATTGQFDYFLLSLSWSPTYCLTHANDESQCGGKGYGLVLHGLWPQYETGGYPEHCDGNPTLSATAENVGRTLYPSSVLMRHEWQTHGTCASRDAKSYFQLEDRALAVVRIPPLLETPRTPLQLTADQLIARFRAANPALPPNGLVIACSRGELSEVRVCLTRDLSPRACGQGVRTACPATPVEIPARR